MEQIFKERGSVLSLSRELGLPYTTVHSWKARGRIPLEYHDDVVLACARMDIAITHKSLRAMAGHGRAQA